MANELTPDYLDEVVNKLSGTSGIVDATYVIAGVKYMDVKVGDRMYYGVTCSNWIVIKKYTE